MNGGISEGRPGREDGRKVILPRGDWRGAILYIFTEALDFNPKIATQFDRLQNVWPGAESHDGIWYLVGDRRDSAQRQLVVLQDAESVFVADASKRYIKLTWSNGAFQSHPAEAEDFGTYLVERALRLFVNTSSNRGLEERRLGLEWTKRALGNLRAAKLWPLGWNTLI